MSSLASIESYPLPKATDLPKNTAQWLVEPKRAVLLFHDMQRYFLAPFSPEIREPLVNNCKRLREQCVNRDIPVMYTAQPGDMTKQQRGLLNDIWGSGMSASPIDREIVEEIAPQTSDHVFTKWRYSAFFESDLLAMMRELKRDQLIICGVYAHIGVLATTIEAFSNDIQTFLIADAIGDFSADHHYMTINYAATRCAVVTTSEKIFE